MSIYHSLEMTTQIISLEVGLAGGREGPGYDVCLDGFSDKGPRGKKGRGVEERQGRKESEREEERSGSEGEGWYATEERKKIG